MSGMDEVQNREELARAQAALQGGDVRAGVQILTRVVGENPSNADARWLLALGLGAQGGTPPEALEHMRAAIAQRPENARWRFDLGQLLEGAGLLEEALEAFGEAERLDPHTALYPARASGVCRFLRDDDGAREAAMRALALDPTEDRALLSMAKDALKRGELEEGESYARRAMTHARSEPIRAAAQHELGRVLEKRRRWDEAFDAHMAANQIKLKMPMARAALASPMFRQFPQYLGHGDAAERYARWAGATYDDGIPAPVILTGFPRSGTTMGEQILGAHPRVTTCEEGTLCVPVRIAMETMFGAKAHTHAILDLLDGLSAEQVKRLRSIYRRELERLTPGWASYDVAVDKHPFRTLDLGLINRLFPGARAIVMIRDPRDVCLSAMFQDFAVNPSSVRMLTPATCAEWYAKAMGFYLRLRGMLGIELLEVRYEDLVRDFETWSRRMVEFIGVAWDERVERFHEFAGTRAIRSFSADAVTERVNTRAIGRWKKYAEKMAPMLERLEPLVEAFGYEPSAGAAGDGG